MIPPTRLQPLEHRLWLRLRRLTREPVLESADEAPPAAAARAALLLVACSGGRDSTALLSASAMAARRMPGVSIAAVYVHHGFHPDLEVRRARDAACDRARESARSLGVEFFAAERALAPSSLRSEADLREYRLARLREIAAATGAAGVLLAHHADDLLETRLIRLIRGTGPEGLEAMRERRGVWWRPWLVESASDVASYAEQAGLHWFDDPTNQSTEPLRNWIRLRWLPELEAKRPGAGRALARSLSLIARSCGETLGREHATQGQTTGEPRQEAALSREEYDALSPLAQCRALAREMKRAGARHVTAARASEAQKRLRSKKKAFDFAIGGVRWSVNAGRIRAELDATAPQSSAQSSADETTCSANCSAKVDESSPLPARPTRKRELR